MAFRFTLPNPIAFSNEGQMKITNGLLREFFLKRTDLTKILEENLVDTFLK